MSSLVAAPVANVRRFWFALPALALAAAAVLANLGVDPTPRAHAVTSQNVAVTATVGTALDMGNTCSSTMGIAVVLGSYADATCPFTFGATNDATTTLRARATTSPFLSGAVFANDDATCSDLGAVDEAGLKVVSVGGTATVAPAWGCAVGAATVNNTLSHKGLTTTAQNVCASGTANYANACTLGIGVFEFGANASAASHTGTMVVDVIA